MRKFLISLVLVAVSGCYTIPVANPGPVANRIVLNRGESATKTVQVEYRNPRKNVISFETGEE
jgi:archaellum component FlaG (FlaF/FlaG flagellin family)